MSEPARARRRRGLLLLALALACGGLAASEVASRVREVEATVGEPVPVLVAARDVAPGAELGRADVAVREVPASFAPPDAMSDAGEAVGVPSAGGLVKGGYLTARVARHRRKAPAARAAAPGRCAAASVPWRWRWPGASRWPRWPGRAAGWTCWCPPSPGEGAGAHAARPGERGAARPQRGGGRRPSGFGDGEDAAGEGAGAGASSVATLRVTVRQAVYLTAAQNFAREVRLLPRPIGDRARTGRAAVTAGGL